MNTKKISRSAPQWGALAVIGGVTVAPALTASSAVQAAPAERYAQASQRVTLTGIVTYDQAGREFRMRSDNGRSFRVIIDEGREPRALSRGDRVRVSGYFTSRDSDIFIAGSLAILSNASGGNWYGNGQVTTLSGVVTRDLANREFRLNTGGREIRVIMDQGREPRTLSRGDNVRVTGRYVSGIFRASSLTITRDVRGSGNYGGGNWYDNGRRTTITGVVTQDVAGNDFLMNTGGRDIRVRMHNRSEPSALTRGDTVRVTGHYVRGLGVFRADSVTITNNQTGSGNWYGNGQVTTLSGVVTRDLANREFRLDTGGREIRVIMDRGVEPRALSRGDSVRVTGRYISGIFRASSLTITRDVRGGNTWPGSTTFPTRSNERANFEGTVVRANRIGGMPITDLQVRVSNGQIYNVRTRSSSSFRVGDRVRVVGTYSDGRVNASSVTRY